VYVLIYVCLLYNAFFMSKDEYGLLTSISQSRIVPSIYIEVRRAPMCALLLSLPTVMASVCLLTVYSLMHSHGWSNADIIGAR
jgi:hypothetical protein